MWAVLADILSLSGLWNYEYIASLWIANKKFMLANVVNVAALWCLWNMRNKICFQGDVWMGMKNVLTGIARTLRRGRPMYKTVMEEELMVIIQKIELEASKPPGISWSPFHSQALELLPLATGCIAVNQQSSELVMSDTIAETSGP